MDQTTNKTQFVGSLLLLFFTIVAIAIFNSPWHESFYHFLHSEFSLNWMGIPKSMSLHHWVSDGLMALFFWYVTIEIKYEMTYGSMSNASAIALPLIGAVGGMLLPALIYLGFNPDIHAQGWGIPMATDIAFSLALLGGLVSRKRKAIFAFLLALAVFDDVGAILIIALYYTKDQLSELMLALSFISMASLAILNTFQRQSIWLYYLIGLVLWVCLLESGIHATVAGVVTALAIPIGHKRVYSQVMRHVTTLTPVVYLFILPVFALFNAGVDLRGFTLDGLSNPVLLGISLGLLLGKPLGIVGFIWVSKKCRWVQLPKSLPMKDIALVGFICGIGFTMSLFIGDLAFDHHKHLSDFVRLGVIAGSLLSALAAWAISKGFNQRSLT